MLAEFLPPRAVPVFASEPTFFSLELNANTNKSIFHKVLQIWRGYEIKVKVSEAMAFFSISRELEKSEPSLKLSEDQF
jgi:hypothetical protein